MPCASRERTPGDRILIRDIVFSSDRRLLGQLEGSELGISAIHRTEWMRDHAHRGLAGMGIDSRAPRSRVVDLAQRPVTMVTGRRSSYLFVASNTSAAYWEVATRRESRSRVGSSS